MDAADWQKHFKAGKGIEGEFVHVQCVVPEARYGCQYLKDLIKLHACHLPTASESQLNSSGMWVVGVRESRSKVVRLFEWQTRSAKTHLEHLHQLMVVENEMHAAYARLEQLAAYGTPFL
ncbi:MAG TPA: hypothetical protein VGE39_17350 [Prosthecobacter sp.]